MKSKSYLDFLGISTSVLCAIHCGVLPFFVSSLPFWGMKIIESLWVEVVLIAGSFIFGMLAFYKGCFKQHKRKMPLALFAVGFILLLLKLYFESLVLLLLPAASILIISSHILNYNFCRTHKQCALH